MASKLRPEALSRNSLKAQALGLLSRREHSRQELRDKLLSRQHRRRAEDSEPGDAPPVEERNDDPLVALPSSLETEVDALLDWLTAKGYLSDERFVESRLNARADRHGSLRIRLELARYGVELDPAQALRLRETEFARAQEVWRRRFDSIACDARGRAAQARFLAARGFPADIVRRIVGGEIEGGEE